MTFAQLNSAIAAPEIFLLAAACLMLFVDRFTRESDRSVNAGIAISVLMACIAVTLMTRDPVVQFAFNDMFVRDLFADVLKITNYVLVGVVFLYARDYLLDRDLLKSEFFSLSLFCLLGMNIMISSHHLLSLYLGLELYSLSIYTLVAFNRDSPIATEAAMKYFVLGALSSGLLLYGISMIYGAAQTLNLSELAEFTASTGTSNVLLVFGLVFLVTGLAFKLGVVPFHMWLPDVYQGSPTPVTALLGTASKIAAFSLFIRALGGGLAELVDDWQGMLLIMSVLSMMIGNIVAIAQTNIKRMLAYSAISHMGFILLGVLAGTETGYSAAMFYAIVYSLTSLGAFGAIIYLSSKHIEAENLSDFKGLNGRSPWFAFIMLLLMFSMAGVPPTAGFYAKLSVLYAVIHAEYTWMAVLAMVFSIIGAFYYLRIIKLMYFDEPDDVSRPETAFDHRMILSMNGLLVLGLGVLPGGLMSLCLMAVTG